MDAIQFLKQEHEKAKEAFARVLAAAPEAREELWSELKPELEAHERIEDECLYEPLSRDLGKTDFKLAGWRKRHQTEVDGLIKDMMELDADGEAWLTKLRAVHARLEHHIREEEHDIFPLIGKVWDGARLARAGTDMRETKAKKLKPMTVR